MSTWILFSCWPSEPGPSTVLKRAQVACRKPSRKFLATRRSAKPKTVQLGPDDTISTAALVRDVILDTSKHSIEATHGGNYVLSHPVDDCLGEAAAHRRRGGERHSRFIGKHDCLEPNDVLHRALACPDNRRQAWGDCKVSGKTLTAQGWCRRFRRFGIDCGRGSEPRPRSRQWNSRSNGEFAGREKGSQSRESFKPHGQPSWRPSAASFDLAPPPGRLEGSAAT